MIFRNFSDQMTNFQNLVRVQPVGGFIEDNKLGMMDDGLCNAQSLLVSSRKVADEATAEMRNAAFFLHLFYRVFNFTVVHQSQLRAVGKILVYIEVAVQGRFLGQKAHIFPGFHRVLLRVDAINKDIPLRLVQDTADDVHRGRFSRAV